MSVRKFASCLDATAAYIIQIYDIMSNMEDASAIVVVHNLWVLLLLFAGKF